MATTRLIPMHASGGKTIAQSISDRTDYALNPEKTDEGRLISAYACDPDAVDVEFLIAKQMYKANTGRESRKARDVIAYQIRQSFLPGEVTPEQANGIGYELAMRFTNDLDHTDPFPLSLLFQVPYNSLISSIKVLISTERIFISQVGNRLIQFKLVMEAIIP